MFKRVAALFTMIAFVLFSASCSTWGMREVSTTAKRPAEGKKIRSVIMTSGELVEFSRSNPGRIQGSTIVGMATGLEGKPLSLKGPFSLIKKRPDGTIYQVVDKEGQVYSVQRVLKESPDQMTILTTASTVARVAIPLSEVRAIQVKKTNGALTALAVVGGIISGGWLLASFVSARD